MKYLTCGEKGNEIMGTNIKNIMPVVNGHKKIIICSGIVLRCVTLYILAPRILMPKPIISKITPSQVMQNCSFNADKSVMLTGENFSSIAGI